MRFDPEHLRAFARRPWAEIERAKREDMAEAYRRDPEAHVDSVEALRVHLRQVRPEWPSAEDLLQDYRDHVALKTKLDRAAPAFLRVGAR